MNMSDMHDEATCPMIMVFHGGHCERILWRGWVASSVVDFTLSCIAWFFIAFAYEVLKFMRQKLHKHTLEKSTEQIKFEIEARRGDNSHPRGCPNARSNLPEIKVKSHGLRIFSSNHIMQSLLNVIQVVISYLLMLIFMTFNYWLCLSVVLGLGFGYFFFGWIGRLETTIIDNECCS